MLAKNHRKEKDSHPDYRGKVNVGGVDYWLSAWIKVGKEGSKLAGEKYFSLSVQPMDEEQQPRRTNASRYPARRPRDDDRRDDRRDERRTEREFNDEIPF